jgi:hypothetical protein
MKTLLALIVAVWASAAFADTAITPPTVGQADPALLENCINADSTYTVASATSVTDTGNLSGEATFTSFLCKLRVHSGRGGGIRIFSGCADVVWDTQGGIVSVAPRAAVSGYYLPSGC